jgi:hypothetical protein
VSFLFFPCRRRRLPRFLTHIADEHGSEAEKMVRNLLEHGRLR